MKIFSLATTLLAALPLAYSAPSAKRVAQIYGEFNNGLIEWVQKYVAPEVVWSIPGSADYSGVYNRTQYLEDLAPAIGRALKKFPTYTVAHSYSEGRKGDWSFTEIQARNGLGVQGTPLNQDQAFFSKWKGEKIIEIHEYLDTLLFQRLTDEAGLGTQA